MTAARRSALAATMTRAHRAARRMRTHFGSYAAALSFALRNVYRAARALAYIARNAGRALVARFVKADGSVRRMRFTAPADPYVTGSVVTVQDLDNGGETRRVNLDTLAVIRTDGRPSPAPTRRDTPPVPHRAPVKPAGDVVSRTEGMDEYDMWLNA